MAYLWGLISQGLFYPKLIWIGIVIAYHTVAHYGNPYSISFLVVSNIFYVHPENWGR